MPDLRAIKTRDRKARAFIDGVGADPVCIGYMPPAFAAQTSAALWLTEEGAEAIRKMERKVIYRKAGLELATDIAQAKWRMEKDGVAVAVTDYFAHTFTATPDGWRNAGCFGLCAWICAHTCPYSAISAIHPRAACCRIFTCAT